MKPIDWIYKQRKKHLPETRWGFPIAMPAARADDDVVGRVDEPRRDKLLQGQRGVSLLIAIMTISVIMSFVSDMIISSSVQVELALSSRDRVKAEYLAKSGFNLALFALTLSHLKDIMMASPQAGPMREAPHDGPDSVWNLFKDLPPLGASTVDLMLAATKGEEDPLHLKGFMNEKVAEQMRLFEDQFSIKIYDESAKINVNDCALGNCREVLAQLTRLFNCPVEKAFLESKNLTGEQLAYRIKDFVRSGAQASSSESGLSGQDPYRELNPPYGFKGLPFDSVDELKLVAGWDDEVHAVFSPYLTVFPFRLKSTGEVRHVLNINDVPSELLSCLLPESKEPSNAAKFAQKMHKLKTDEESLAKDPSKIAATIAELANYRPGAGATAEGGDGAQPEKWFDVYSNLFRIVVDAQTGNRERHLEVVVQRFDPGEEKRDNTMKKLKDQRPYRVLYWKLI